MTTARVLYITYDGLTDPLGQSQVLPYLIGLAAHGHRITILSCEKPAAFANEGARVRELCETAGIDWRPLRYHKSPPVLSSALDMLMIQQAAVRLHLQRTFDMVHCRSYIPAAAGLRLKRRFGVPLLFDMRGFWPEEKTEGGSWNLRNPAFRLVYRYFKRLERRLLAESDAIVSLTEAGKTELLRRAELRDEAQRVAVIPCCVDVRHFALAGADARRAARRDLGIPDDAAVLAYLGSLGGNYMLGEMFDFFRIYRERHRDARFLLVTREHPRGIRAEASRRGISGDEVIVRPAPRTDVPGLLAGADLGIAFKQPSFSALGCSPTKLGEMMAVGLPLVANAGVGDVAEILARTGGGVAVTGFGDDAYRAALSKIEADPAGAARLRQSAIDGFDVALGIERYDRIYHRLLKRIGNRQARG